MFLFNLNGPVGSNYVIQVSSNLVNWLNWVTNTIPGGGLSALDFPIQPNQPEMFFRALPTSASPPPAPILIATNLAGPGFMVLDGNYLYFGDSSSTDGMIKSVPRSGGTVTTLLTGLSTSESRLPDFVVTNGTIYGGYGGYNGYHIFSAPTTGGTVTHIIFTTGGNFIGVANSLIYYGSDFNYINSVTTSGANPTQLVSGIWVRGKAVDADAIYFCDYFSKDLRKYSFASGTVTPLVTGNPSEVGVFIDANNVYFNTGGGNIEAVPNGGGTVTTLVSSGTANGYASDGVNVFYVDNNVIKSIPVSGGTPTTLISIPANSLSDIVVDDTYIYWNDTSGGAGAGSIWRMVKP